MVASISPGPLGRTLVFLSPILIPRHMSFIFLRYDQIKDGGLISTRYSLLNDVPVWEHIVKAYLKVKKPFLYCFQTVLPNDVVHVIQ